MTVRRALGWLGVVALLELVARAVVYGLAPSPTEAARELHGHLGGPSFAATLVVALTVGALLATVLVALASLGVRERWELAEERLAGAAPRVAVGRLLRRAAVLTLVGWLTFATIETLLHLNAGLGFHGLECLIGPVHRNALPVIGGLALLASAVVAAAGLVLTWMRRTVRAFGAVRPVATPTFAVRRFSFVSIARRAPLVLAAAPRGPPRIAV